MKTGSFVKIGIGMAVIAFFLSGCHFGGVFKAEFGRSEELSASLAGIDDLDVTTNVGEIRLEATEVSEARILADIKVRAKTEEEARELAELVRIVAEPSGQTLAIKAVKPAHFGRNELCVDFTITAPAGLALDCTTNVGDIRTTGFTESVKARTDVGKIHCTGLRDAVDLHTNVGDIAIAYVPDAPAVLDVRATTNVGAIDFTGPEDISAGLSAYANVGDIETDRPVLITGSLKKSIKASLGNAEGEIALRTNVGSIRIR